MMDWNGNRKTVFLATGASNHAIEARAADDYYATEPLAMELLLAEETFNRNVWECACGAGHLAEVLKAHGHDVRATDIIYRGYGTGGVDFLTQMEPYDGDIITNPPYKYAQRFVEKALALVPDGHKVAMFLRVQFLESQQRRTFFRETPPETVYVACKRIRCAMNGDFDKYEANSAVAYAWFVWKKGNTDAPRIKWIN